MGKKERAMTWECMTVFKLQGNLEELTHFQRQQEEEQVTGSSAGSTCLFLHQQ